MFVPTHTDELARLTVLPLVSVVLNFCGWSKVFPSVVAPITVDVIHLVLWPSSCHEKKSYSMEENIFSHKSALSVPMIPNTSESWFTRVSSVPV